MYSNTNIIQNFTFFEFQIMWTLNKWKPNEGSFKSEQSVCVIYWTNKRQKSKILQSESQAVPIKLEPS